jgi:hypothetical protein
MKTAYLENLAADERVLKQGQANWCRALSSQGGTLFLTNKKLVFLGHGMNVGQQSIVIELKNIISQTNAFTFNLFCLIPVPNSIKVIANDGRQYKFTVISRAEWLASLHKAIQDREY